MTEADDRGDETARGDGGTRAPERTFAALPVEHGGAFARTWWGRAWLKALEDTALDNAQVKLGRRHARAGAVGAVSVRPGRITAVVQDRDHTHHRSDVLLQQLDDADWDRLLDVMADRAGHIAALLDRDIPPVLVEDAGAAGIELLPGIGDLESECSCDAWDHCAHSAALCYQLARLLDEDPFLLLLMRGRGERELLDELQARSAARAEPAPGGAAGARATEPAGIPAAEVFAARDILPPLPDPPPPVDVPGTAPSLSGGAPPAPGVDVPSLEFLTADTAARARHLLAEALSARHPDTPPAPALTPAQDAVRLAAAGPDAAVTARLAAGSGRDARALSLAVRAWRLGAAAALEALEEDHAPGPDALARAEDRLAAAWEEGEPRPRLRAARGRWTVVGEDTQVRYGRDGRWWPYRKEHGRWAPAGPASDDPAAALASLSAAEDTP
ncbi:SWF or SNF family helicase [Streptomyces pinistramenti]|uniref:SWF or SNF family helicase n=1 Tax=Streptomyces pinistramenti TaxID=2884812 RepID=UPI001D0825D2|nr:SWF or SNF family helicase [Streptomyces pinistramenti]MCB5906376.1 SWF or SNF family helicase [Streptomyces pinistramenti]